MPPEDPKPFDSSDAADPASRYDYSAAEQPADEAQAPSTPPERPPAQKPLGLQRSDRVQRLSQDSSSASNVFSVRSADRAAGSSGGLSGGLSGGGDRVGNLSGNRSVSPGSADAQSEIAQLVRQGLRDLENQRRSLLQDIEQLERRKARIEDEMRANFSGASQDVAIRVQAFKNYLVGSLQDLVTAAEEMDLTPMAAPAAAAAPTTSAPQYAQDEGDARVPFAAQRFAQQRDRINSLLDQYRTRPDYYGPPWQLRRTFEPVHGDRTANWFFTQGGRGAIKSLGSRLQNVLVASAAVSCLYSIYDQRLCVLVLATTPERLGEWRRWLQECLGIDRADFGTNRGVMLFEDAEPMTQRAERLLDNGRIPFLIMDEAETKVSLSLLQFPLWLGFAPDPANPSADYDYY
jgi:hypothetical protein